MADALPGHENTSVRVVGGGNTLFQVNGQNVAYLKSFTDTAPKPVGTGAKAIQGIDDPHPVEIITSHAVGEGTLTAGVVEVYDDFVWNKVLGLLKGSDQWSKDIIDIYNYQDKYNIQCTMLIKKGGVTQRTKTYHGIKITSIGEDENVTLEAMEKEVTITMMYTHFTVT